MGDLVHEVREHLQGYISVTWQWLKDTVFNTGTHFGKLMVSIKEINMKKKIKNKFTCNFSLI
jgi:hypothetical protein